MRRGEMPFTVALAQMNPTVGDFEGNRTKIVEQIRRAKREGAKLVVFPELAITGYPPKDLLFKREFLNRNRDVLDDITGETEGIGVVIGFVDFYQREKGTGTTDTSSPFTQEQLVLHNAACLLQHCRMLGKVYKVYLPNYDVFDEKRYFTPGKECPVFEFEGEKVGVNICEDMWFDEGPTKEQIKRGAQLIINVSASPFYAGKREVRRQIIGKQARQHRVPIIYVNMVGGQDDLIFDGSSYVFNAEGSIIARGSSFDEDFLLIDGFDGPELSCEEDTVANIFEALVLGTRDYAVKNGFDKCVIGLSGGIDSALTSVIACEALGEKQVMGLLMPGPYSSPDSVNHARELADNLGMVQRVVPITDIYQRYLDSLNPHFEGTPVDITEENIQARIRGNMLMAFSNKFHLLVLSTGNKSEYAVGYSTLYGDMAGGLAVIADVPKTMVYRLSRYYNEIKGSEIIPEAILTKPPSAELRPHQKDSDDLPDYKILDGILDLYIERGWGFDSIVENGYDSSVVSDILKRINRSEFKRKQGPLGLKITPKAFGFGRRMPITNRFLR
jgi:NAD+ synthase (glutamine-hydrolysing)